MYTDIPKVRLEADMRESYNINDSTIQGYIESAHAEVLSRIAGIYDLTQISTWFTWSSAEAYLSRAETLIADWSLINGEIIQDWVGEYTYWDKKMNQGYSMLDKIITQSVILLNINGEQFQIKKTGDNAMHSRLGSRNTEDDLFKFNDKY